MSPGGSALSVDSREEMNGLGLSLVQMTFPLCCSKSDELKVCPFFWSVTVPFSPSQERMKFCFYAERLSPKELLYFFLSLGVWLACK